MFLLEGGEADGEGELGLLALGALEGGAAARAEGADGVGLRRARHRHQAVGEGAVQVPARDVAFVPVAEAAVAVPQRLLEEVARRYGRFFSVGHLSFLFFFSSLSFASDGSLELDEVTRARSRRELLAGSDARRKSLPAVK